ncbi:pilus assembly protein CpaB [Gemmobacter megaterium]|uniref:Pilus assembly protein CpaB n=1 Tax=Gemmobacter megaterium TaxID=1086013 RepID=A0A1N7LYV1_9RHOB|nr:Flp pilus assembly protein CpaB [Gemmobacter megaterium]GGE09810.1 Flp pilus assembly protein CpaB [Gemmobacter megaterium]SIS79025.1 pilus assembly protein CpaB [Gemmobacter megaterium]
MRMVFSLVMVLGIALAGFAAWKTSQFINVTKAREQAALRRIVPTVEVFVAKKPLPFGHVLTPDDVVKVAWPKNALPENTFQDPALLFPGDGARQRTVIRQMEKFEPLLVSKVTEPGEDAGLNTRLGRGMRAFTIRVDASSGVSGFLRPGDRVDIYWTGTTAGLTDERSGEITKLIESGINIVAIDQNTEGGSSSAARTVTVEISPQQVARLAQAQMTGRLALSLVGIADDTQAAAADVDKRGLLGIEREEIAPVEAARVCTIRTRKGAEVVEIPIPCTN